MNISEMQSKIEKMGFVLEIKAFQVVVRKSAYCDGILVIGGQRVNKQSEDFRCD